MSSLILQPIEPREPAPERIRRAQPQDMPALNRLVVESMRGLGTQDYSAAQIESALLYLLRVDEQLIACRTYYVAEIGTQVVGGGGWSRGDVMHGTVRREHAAAYARWLDTIVDAARIRALYVDPRWARRGIGRRLLSICERAAHRAGFDQLALIATVGGVPLYRAAGYSGDGQLDFVLPDGTVIPAMPMTKRLAR